MDFQQNLDLITRILEQSLVLHHICREVLSLITIGSNKLILHNFGETAILQYLKQLNTTAEHGVPAI